MRRIGVFSAVVLLAALLVPLGSSSAAPGGRFTYTAGPGRPRLSGPADAGLLRTASRRDAAAEVTSAVARSARQDDVQLNADSKRDAEQRVGNGGGFPQNETSVAVNPRDPNNVIAGANDYESGVDSVMGVYSSFDGGRTWPYSRHTPQVITPDRQMYGTGDPVIAFDRAGTAYASFIAFGRANCDSYVATVRSYDKGVVWSAPVGEDPESVAEGTEMLAGDGIVVHNEGPEDCQIFHDKEWMTTGKRPHGVPLVRGTDRRHLSPDRLYVTWTRFDFGPQADTYVESPIYIAYSDDEGRHWSVPKEISGRSPLCAGLQTGDQDGDACDESQFSVPVVDPRSGTLYVGFENFNVNSTVQNQYLVVRSTNGGATFSAPSKAGSVFDGADKYPICEDSQTLDLMCARIIAPGNIDVDRRTGALYVTWADNRNGTARNTNSDVFVTRSSDGGRTWSRAHNLTGGSRDDQWFPWLSVSPTGTVAVTYFDRRYSGPKLIDTSLSVSTNGAGTFARRRVSDVSWNPDLAFRLGIFIGDYNALDTTATTAFPVWTDARFGEPNVPGNNPPRQQSDVWVDVEPLP